MSLFKKISDLFSSTGDKDDSAYWVYVKCNRCGEAIRTRIDMRHDLSMNYGSGEADTTYFCRKTLMGEKRCFQRIEVELTFDHRRQLLDRQIHGGEFITEEEYSSTET
jgi:hypothetical protein